MRFVHLSVDIEAKNIDDLHARYYARIASKLAQG